MLIILISIQINLCQRKIFPIILLTSKLINSYVTWSPRPRPGSTPPPPIDPVVTILIYPERCLGPSDNNYS